MKFRVIGSSKETGARMTLEFEALSKAAAERKAQQAGMAVNRLEMLGQADTEPLKAVARSGSRTLLKVVVFVAVVVVAYLVLRDRGIVH